MLKKGQPLEIGKTGTKSGNDLDELGRGTVLAKLLALDGQGIAENHRSRDVWCAALLAERIGACPLI